MADLNRSFVAGIATTERIDEQMVESVDDAFHADWAAMNAANARYDDTPKTLIRQRWRK
jgi:hypothetical protein